MNRGLVDLLDHPDLPLITKSGCWAGDQILVQVDVLVCQNMKSSAVKGFPSDHL